MTIHRPAPSSVWEPSASRLLVGIAQFSRTTPNAGWSLIVSRTDDDESTKRCRMPYDNRARGIRSNRPSSQELWCKCNAWSIDSARPRGALAYVPSISGIQNNKSFFLLSLSSFSVGLYFWLQLLYTQTRLSFYLCPLELVFSDAWFCHQNDRLFWIFLHWVA